MLAKTIISCIFAFCFPSLLYIAGFHATRYKKTIPIILFCAYSVVILYFTLFNRSVQNKSYNLIPFWSYAYFTRAEYRWQVYMNIFLFIPFGFLLPYAVKRRFIQTFSISLVFSTLIEASQFFFNLGLCEFDDVFHNTLGSVIGYGYWRLLTHFEKRYGEKMHMLRRSYLPQAREKASKAFSHLKEIIKKQGLN